MKASSAGVKAALLGFAAVALTACGQPSGDSSAAAATTAAQGTGAYQAPRTSWGDPDLQGRWPGTAMVGVPMQRDEKLGLRNVLTEEEFAAREAQFARQAEQDRLRCAKRARAAGRRTHLPIGAFTTAASRAGSWAR